MTLSNRLLLAITITQTLALSIQAGPKIEVPEGTFNFGKTPQHVTVIHDFWIKSVGDDTLRITDVFPGCGCTQVPISDSTIAPGDSTLLRIILDTRAFMGQVMKKPSIITNADTAKVYLKIYAEMEPDLAVSRPLQISHLNVDVSQFGEKPRRRGQFMIANHSNDDFSLAMIDSAGRSFDIVLPEVIGANDTVDVFVIVREDAIETDFTQSFTFEATSANMRVRHTVPVVRIYQPKKED